MQSQNVIENAGSVESEGIPSGQHNIMLENNYNWQMIIIHIEINI